MEDCINLAKIFWFHFVLWKYTEKAAFCKDFKLTQLQIMHLWSSQS